MGPAEALWVETACGQLVVLGAYVTAKPCAEDVEPVTRPGSVRTNAAVRWYYLLTVLVAGIVTAAAPPAPSGACATICDPLPSSTVPGCATESLNDTVALAAAGAPVPEAWLSALSRSEVVEVAGPVGSPVVAQAVGVVLPLLGPVADDRSPVRA